MRRRHNGQRWTAPDGTEWDSIFEWQVFQGFKEAGLDIRKCDERDTISYGEQKQGVRCMECGSSRCVQQRRYTPDLLCVREGGSSHEHGSEYLIEVKGYFRREKRTLFRSMRNDQPHVDLRVVLASDHWVTKGKTRITDYLERYVKNTPYFIWNGPESIPESWR